MNAYFLVEGKRTEKRIYPYWISYLIPHMTEKKNIEDITDDCYFLISGEGYPSILGNHLQNSINDIEKYKSFDVFYIILDAEEDDPNEKIEEVENAIQKASPPLESATPVVIIQHCCIESWLLGNKNIFKHNPQDKRLLEYIKYYNVFNNDPELMPSFKDGRTKAQYHLCYLKRIFTERNISYSKRNPGHAKEKSYFESLIDRIKSNKNEMNTFRNMIDKINMLK